MHNNPRLGQVATLLMFTPGPWHELFTPVLELATFYLLVALVFGRWPRTTDDALVFLATFAITAVTAPQFGVMLFYRPYTGNYVFGLCINLAFLVPYRFGRVGWWIVALGLASGLCNEHTGPAVVALAAAATWASGVRPWKIAGLLAMIAGGIALFVAPGQDIRYNSIGQTSLVERVAERGIAGNLEVVGTWFVYLAPALIWLAIAGVAWWRQRRALTDRAPGARTAQGRARADRGRVRDRRHATAVTEDRPAAVLRVVRPCRRRDRTARRAPRPRRDDRVFRRGHRLRRGRVRARLSRRRRAVGRPSRDVAAHPRVARPATAGPPAVALAPRRRHGAARVSSARRQGVRYTAGTMSEITLELFKRLPKTDLHCHLDGSLRLDTVLDLAKQQKVKLPTFDRGELFGMLVRRRARRRRSTTTCARSTSRCR